jgi:hypothetical protein
MRERPALDGALDSRSRLETRRMVVVLNLAKARRRGDRP